MNSIAEVEGMHLLGKENRHGERSGTNFEYLHLNVELCFENFDIRIRIINTVLVTTTKQTENIYRVALMGLALSLSLLGIEK